MILITGATWRIGSKVFKQLAAARRQIRVRVRNAQKAADLRRPNVALVVGDLSKLETPGQAIGDGREGVPLLKLSASYASGNAWIVTNVVAETTGRPARTFDRFAREFAGVFSSATLPETG